MARLILMAALSALATAAPAQSAAVSLSPSAQKDVQCFLLYAAAVGAAAKTNNQNTKEAASLGLMYFLGKLQAGAPGLNLLDAVRQQAKVMDGSPSAKEIGTACDAEFTARGAELKALGGQLQKPAP
jgi:hypothetical protein